MDQAALANADRRVAIERETQLAGLEDDVNRIRAHANARGMLHSSAMLMETARACADAIERRADFTWAILHRVATTTGITYRPELEQTLKAFIDEQLRPNPPDIVERALRDVRAFNMTNLEPQLMDLLRQRQTRAIARVRNEIELFVASLQVRARRVEEEGDGRVSITNYGPVGAIQTGRGATAYVHQALDADTRACLEEALRALAEALPRATGLPMPERELAEVVADARTEVAKAEPNRTKLKGYLETITAAVTVVRDLKDVGEMLKPALGAFGLDL